MCFSLNKSNSYYHFVSKLFWDEARTLNSPGTVPREYWWRGPKVDEAGKGNLEEQLKGMGEKTANGKYWKGRWSRGGKAGQEGAAKPASTKAGGAELTEGAVRSLRQLWPCGGLRCRDTQCPQHLTTSCTFSVKKELWAKTVRSFPASNCTDEKTKKTPHFSADKVLRLLVVQGLRLCAPTVASTGLNPGHGTKIPHAAWCSQNKKQKTRLHSLKASTSTSSIYSRAINKDMQSIQANGQSLKSCLLHIHIPLLNNLNVPKWGIV